MADDEHMGAILQCMEQFQGNKAVQTACSRAVELICKSAKGREAFLRSVRRFEALCAPRDANKCSFPHSLLLALTYC